MPHNITRDILNYYQGLFDTLQSTSPNDIATNNKRYTQLREILDFIRDGASSIEGISESKFIFLVGPTGAGKSTLSNYLRFGDEGFVAASNDGKGEIKLKNLQDSIANIGSGKGSTTVVPNMYKINGIDGIFLDCAGDGDTSGIIGDIINAMVRNKISQNAQQAKIALIAKQGSLDSNGGYGELFKSSLDQNVQFFKDIEFFKDSLGFVITGAGRRLDVIESIKKDLHNIADHPNFTKYKNLMKHILAKSEASSLIVPFAKAPEEANENDPYSARIQSQHTDIKNMIQNLPYSQLPFAGYFEVPKSIESDNVLNYILEAIVARGNYIIRKAIDNTPHPLNIYSVEVNPFDKYISGLANGYKTDYIKYYKILKHNNYLKINNKYDQDVKTIDSDIKFVSNYVKKNIGYRDWTESSQIRGVFNSIKNDVLEFKTENSGGNLFNSTVNKQAIKISFVNGDSYKIKKAIDMLKDNLREIDILTAQKGNTNSDYYKDVTQKVFSHNEREQYYETIWKTRPVEKPYETIETYTVQEEATRIKWVQEEEKYTQPELRVVNGYTETVNTGGYSFGGVHYKSIASAPKRIKSKLKKCTKEIKHPKQYSLQDVQKVKMVQKPIEEKYTKPVDKIRQVVKYRTENEQYPEQVEKYRDKPVYKNITVREFDQEKYQTKLSELQSSFMQNSEDATSIMNGIPVNDRCNATTKENVNNPHPQVKDLLVKWQDAEINQYFNEYPTHSLEVLDIETIGNNVEGFDGQFQM